jgi:hypothetical protein
MSTIWNKYLEDFGDDEGHEYEVEKRNENPTLYDCALAICEYDEPNFLKENTENVSFSVNALTPRTEQPLLYLAITKNRLESCKILIENGANLSYREMDKSYLWWAIFTGASIQIVQMLLRNSTDSTAPIIELPEEELQDLIERAERKSSEEVIQLLKSLKS